MLGKVRAPLRQSRAQERSVARDLPGGKTIAGSGAGPLSKGDVKARQYLVECKTSQAASRGVVLQEWYKVEGEARRAFKEPVLVIWVSGVRLAVVSYDYFGAVQERAITPCFIFSANVKGKSYRITTAGWEAAKKEAFLRKTEPAIWLTFQETRVVLLGYEHFLATQEH